MSLVSWIPLWTVVVGGALSACEEEGFENGDTGAFADALPGEELPVPSSLSLPWVPLAQSDYSPADRIDSLYGRSVGTFAVPGGSCSGTLVSDEYFVTSQACTATASITVDFGRFDTSTNSYAQGRYEGVRRLIQLGVDAATAAASPAAGFTQFNCTLQTTDNAVALYRCTGRPGRIWGFVRPTTQPLLSAGTPVVGLSAARTCAQQVAGEGNNILYSPGSVVGPAGLGACVGVGCFTVTTDTTERSAGAGLLANHALSGVLTGFPAPAVDACVEQAVTNVALPFPQPLRVLAETQEGANVTLGPSTRDHNFVGRGTGAVTSGDCTMNSGVAGIVGTTAANGDIGNLGAVCLFRNPVDSNFDRATVIAAGTTDVTLGSVTNYNLNRYLHESLRATNQYEGRQSLAMCPDGTWLHALEVDVSGYDPVLGYANLNAVRNLICKDPTNMSNDITRSLTTDSGFIGTNPGSTVRVKCPGAIVSGVRLHADSTTHRIELNCRLP